MRAVASTEVVARRLRSQRLSDTTFDSPAQVVAWLGAVQAQDYLGALWAIGLRVRDGSASDVERALDQGTIIRSWPMRGTLHLVAAADARWLIELLAPKAVSAAAGRFRALGLDDGLIRRARQTLVEQLEGGKRLTRPSVYRAFERARIPTTEQRGLHLLWRLAHDRLICFGPREGKQQTIVLFDEWLPAAKRRPRDEALAELARRYFTGHGPATDRDFSWWSGLTLTEARRSIALAGRELTAETILGQPHWSGAAPAGAEPTAARDRAYALPPYDELMVGYADRSAAIDPEIASRLSAFDVLGPVVVHGGRLVATWGRRITGRRVRFSVAHLAPVTARRSTAIARALDRYARFFDLVPDAPHSEERRSGA
jgi:hypothetical protein